MATTSATPPDPGTASTPAGSTRTPRTGMFRSLGHPNYRLYFAGGLVSNIGTWLQRVGQDWLVLHLPGGNAVSIGITTGLQFLPFLLLAPMAGVVADRIPKRRLLQVTNLGMALPAAVLAVLALTGTARAWHVYVLAFVLGVAAVFDAPARQSFVSELVEPQDLPNAIGLNSSSFNAARLVGPGLAGVLIAALGGGVEATGWVIALNAVSYAAPIWMLSRLDPALLHPVERPPRTPVMARAGFAYVRSQPHLMTILLIVFSVGTFGLNFQMTSALMATQVFHQGAGEYGALGSFLAVGSLAGSLVAARRVAATLRLVVGAAIAFGVVVVLAGLAPTYTVFALACPLIGLSALTMLTSANAYFQMHTAPHLRGRAMAVYLMVFMGGTPIGSPVIGVIGEQFGARWTLILGGVLTLAGVALAVLLHWRQQRRQLRSAATNATF